MVLPLKRHLLPAIVRTDQTLEHSVKRWKLVRDIDDNMAYVIKAIAKEAFGRPPVFLDVQRFLLGQPHPHRMGPTEGQCQDHQQFAEPVRSGQMGLFQAKAPTFQTAEEGFNSPSASVIRHDGGGKLGREHQQIVAIREAETAEIQRVAPDRAGLLQEQGLAEG